ncbi:MAG: hypothetical protein B7Z08_11130 [Sphingomonadales bacterium 32-68-7]|nr:MAG: hypothetical protein B7Z33_11365 [Sphingomonadales bacterium 12-68-11]OYX08040.1 MAG: hypothetical protein B7Z08_11130 [Sphingomonadales bacterium 32-68-7]
MGCGEGDPVAAVVSEEWNGRTGQAWADEWRRTDRAFGPLTERLLQRSRGRAIGQVLDVGCGAGELSLAFARGRPLSAVTGIDLSEALIAVARARGGHLDNARFECADAGAWRPEGPFAADLVVSRHGVMFFDRPVPALTHLASLTAPDAGLVASCFRDRTENPFFTELADLVPGEPGAPSDPAAPGPFAWADRDRVAGWLTDAGWADVGFEPFDYAMIIGAGDDPVGDAVGYCLRIGPAARAAADLDAEGRARFLERVAALADRHSHEGVVALRAAAWIVTARRP